MGEEDEAGGIDEDVPLAACGPLRSVISARSAADASGAHRLAVDDRGRWLGVAPRRFAGEHAQLVVHAPKRAIEPPAAEMCEDRRPWRKGRGQHAPGATGTDKVEDSLDPVAARPLERPPSGCRWRKQWLRRCPLGIREVCRMSVLTAGAHGCLGLKI
jgi:hypothetical protein